jgi:hypothetical protein
MEITACHNTNPDVVKPVGRWQTIALVAGAVVFFLLLACFMYKFVAQTNNKLKAVEQALNALSAKQQSLPQSQPQPAHVFMRQHEPVMMVQPPLPRPQAPPAPAPVVVDAKALDKELTEELKELSVEVPEGRVDTTPEERKS